MSSGNKPKSQVKKTLTPEQAEKIFLTPCRTRDELKNFIKYFFELELPDQNVSRYSDTNPLDVVWEMYDICVNKHNPENVQELLYVAARGSGKCSSQGTNILTKTGIKTIENVIIGDIVWTGWSWQPVKEFFDEGIKDGVTIQVLDYPNMLSGSLKHRIQVLGLNGFEWRYMKDLAVGDKVFMSDTNISVIDGVEKNQIATISKVTFELNYFYDLEVNKDHSYWSNGFISHNTLGVAIAELLILLHDRRDCVHLGAIMSQSKRCYNYIQKFILNSKIKPIILPPDRKEDDRILEKSNMEKSIFNLRGEKVTLEVLPVTLKACLISLSKVLDSQGKIILISDIKPGDYILSIDGPVKVINNTPDFRECLRIELDDGRIIEGTLDHRVWTQRGWVELQHITESDDICSFESPKE